MHAHFSLSQQQQQLSTLPRRACKYIRVPRVSPPVLPIPRFLDLQHMYRYMYTYIDICNTHKAAAERERENSRHITVLIVLGGGLFTLLLLLLQTPQQATYFTFAHTTFPEFVRGENGKRERERSSLRRRSREIAGR